MYQFILGAVGDLNIPVLLLFALGAVIGIIAFSNFLSWLLDKYHDLTIALLTVMLGSLIKSGLGKRLPRPLWIDMGAAATN